MRGKHKSRHQNKNNRLPTIAVIILISALAVTLAAADGCTAAQKHGEPPADTVHISPPLPTPAQTSAATPAQTPTATPAQTPLPTPAQTPLPTPAQTPTEIPTETPTETPLKLASATIAVTGDILMHTPIVNAGRSGDTYNFDSIFAYIKNYVSAADYAAANLETTLAGTENGYAYSGYPDLNTPDEIVDAVKTAGFDMLLTANNHCYDTASAGFNRTPRIIEEKGVEFLGTSYSEKTPRYRIIDVNGIKIGMICYTYAKGGTYEHLIMHGKQVLPDDINKLNFFLYRDLERFYSEMTAHIAAMRAEGAEALVLYIHWGKECQLAPNSYQIAIAQKMCDLGIDVIVGGHPHVIQPVELLTSAVDPTHKTLCLYSMGNAVSNQRRKWMSNDNDVGKEGYTEDGLLFSFTFTKYSDGSVLLGNAEILPTWVYLRSKPALQYNILPLDKSIADWKKAFGIGDAAFNLACESYERTMALVSKGLEAANDFFTQMRLLKEAEQHH